MKPTIKKLPNSQVAIEVTINKTDFKPYWEAAYEKARLGIELKGFRPGTAPKEMTDPLINKDKVFHEAAESAIRNSLREIAEENDWQIISQPEISVDEKDLNLVYKAKLTLFPEVKIADYKKIAKQINEEFAAELAKVTAEDEDINRSLEWLRTSRAPEVRAARKAVKGDVAEADVHVSSGGQKIPAAEIHGGRFVLGASNLLPGLDEVIIGRGEGEQFTVKLKVPENYWQKELAGKELDCEVAVKAIFERKLPELNDEFAKSLGPNFKNLEEVKKSIRDGVIEERREAVREKSRLKVIEAVTKDSQIDPPEVMINRTLDSLIREFHAFAAKSGKSDEELRKELKDRAREDVLRNLVIYDIVRKEKLEPTPEEVEAEKIRRGETPSGVDARAYDDYIYGVLLNQKAFQFLENIK